VNEAAPAPGKLALGVGRNARSILQPGPGSGRETILFSINIRIVLCIGRIIALLFPFLTEMTGSDDSGSGRN
jgi:hypothetical protein